MNNSRVKTNCECNETRWILDTSKAIAYTKEMYIVEANWNFSYMLNVLDYGMQYPLVNMKEQNI